MFMVAVDYLTGKGAEHGLRPWQSWQTVALKATNVFEAMDEAEDFNNEGVYMLHLCQKLRQDGDWNIIYKAVLAHRKAGWHTQSYKHYEQENFGFSVDMGEYGGFEYASVADLEEEEK